MNPPQAKSKLDWRAALAVLLLHGAVAAGLAAAFAPRLVSSDAVSRMQAVLVSVPARQTPSRPPLDPARHAVRPRLTGVASTAAKKAEPLPVSAPRAPIALSSKPAAPVSGEGRESASGAAPSGSGTGAQGLALGAGGGGRGSVQDGGQGSGRGGGESAPVKIAGDINSARDYPPATRELRINARVVIVLTVGVDGRVRSCRVVQPSPDDDADRVTCRLASERFRFRPARDASGQPVEAIYGWQQRWFYR